VELDEIKERRKQVQFAIDHMPYYATVDFIVKTTAEPPNLDGFKAIEAKRGVRSYKTVVQKIGMLIDTPISFKTTELQPYTQGMYVVYDEEMAFPYPYYQYDLVPSPPTPTEYIVPPLENLHFFSDMEPPIEFEHDYYCPPEEDFTVLPHSNNALFFSVDRHDETEPMREMANMLINCPLTAGVNYSVCLMRIGREFADPMGAHTALMAQVTYGLTDTSLIDKVLFYWERIENDGSLYDNGIFVEFKKYYTQAEYTYANYYFFESYQNTTQPYMNCHIGWIGASGGLSGAFNFATSTLLPDQKVGFFIEKDAFSAIAPDGREIFIYNLKTLFNLQPKTPSHLNYECVFKPDLSIEDTGKMKALMVAFYQTQVTLFGEDYLQHSANIWTMQSSTYADKVHLLMNFFTYQEENSVGLHLVYKGEVVRTIATYKTDGTLITSGDFVHNDMTTTGGHIRLTFSSGGSEGIGVENATLSILVEEEGWSYFIPIGTTDGTYSSLTEKQILPAFNLVPPPDPPEPWEPQLKFVRPGGIIAREADSWELTMYNKSNLISKRVGDEPVFDAGDDIEEEQY